MVNIHLIKFIMRKYVCLECFKAAKDLQNNNIFVTNYQDTVLKSLLIIKERSSKHLDLSKLTVCWITDKKVTVKTNFHTMVQEMF